MNKTSNLPDEKVNINSSHEGSGDIVVNDKITNNITNNIYNLSETDNEEILSRAIANKAIINNENKQVSEQELIKNYKQRITGEFSKLKMIGFQEEFKKFKFEIKNLYIQLRMVCEDNTDKTKCGTDRNMQALKAEELLNLPEKVIVVKAGPGMGKSTMMKYLAYKTAEEINDKTGVEIPIYIELADLGRNLEKYKHLEEYLLDRVEIFFGNNKMNYVAQKIIKENKALILLDGLDEVSRENNLHKRVNDMISTFVFNNKDTRVIITSRIYGCDTGNIEHSEYKINPLEIPEIGKFIDFWSDGEESNLLQIIKKNDRLFEMAQIPFLLSIICLLYSRDKKHFEENPYKQRFRIYKECASTLLDLIYIKDKTNKPGIEKELKEILLEELAYEFFKNDKDLENDESSENNKGFSQRDAFISVNKIIGEHKKNSNSEEILNEICKSELLQKSEDKYLFVHRTFMEYFASCKMKNKGMSINEILDLDDKVWKEPICLYSAQLESKKEGTAFIQNVWEKNRELALACYQDMGATVDIDWIRKVLKPNNEKTISNRLVSLAKKLWLVKTSANANATTDDRVILVRGLLEKGTETEVIETLRELFEYETNGEILYWGAKILEDRIGTKEAKDIVAKKFDEGAIHRYQKHIEKDMIGILEGSFLMGTSDEEVEEIIKFEVPKVAEEHRDRYTKFLSSEKPIHNVKISSFLINKYQVTNSLYEEFDPSHKSKRDEYSNEGAEPVVYINWYEATMFARWLGCELPTEAQWEYACRGGTTSLFSTGDNLTTEQANYNGNFPFKNYPKGEYKKKTMRVGSYPQNSFGLYDMHGNVYEWCSDWYGQYYYEKCNQNEISENPTGEKNGTNRVLRGGSWGADAQDCRSADRNFFHPDNRNNYVGFRLDFVP